MTAEARPPLFRPEAVEHHSRGRDGGRPVDVAHRRTARASLVLAAAIVVATLAGCLVRADETAEGPLAPPAAGAAVIALVPAAAMGQLHAGLRATVHTARGTDGGTVIGVGEPVAGSGGTAVVPVSLRIDAVGGLGAVATSGPGRAVIRLRRRPVVSLLVPSLRSLVARG